MTYLLLMLAASFVCPVAVGATSRSRSYFDLDLIQNRYLGEVQNSSQAADHTSLNGDIILETSSVNHHFKFNPVTQNALNLKNEFYYGVPELFYKAKQLVPSVDVTVGREKRTWSHLDEEFNLGVWQPQLRWDYLAPKQQGLVGIFVDVAPSMEWQITLFWSPVFLPDQGPNYELNNGRFVSENRWFRQPQSRLSLFSQSAPGGGGTQDVPIYYKIDRPPEKQVIENQSFGLGIGYHSDAPFWVQLSYAYKPQNQIHLGAECRNCFLIPSPTRPAEINAIVHPAVVKHHVVTVEAGFKQTDDQGYASLTGDFPDASGFPVDYEESALNSMYIAGASYSRYLFSWFNMPNWMKLSYVRLLIGQSKTKRGQIDSDEVQSSFDRYPLREVAAVEWKIRLSQKQKNKLDLKTRYNYSPAERGGWLSASLNLEQGPLTWNVGLDFLGSDVGVDSPRAGLYTRYSANDRVYGGVSYVF